MLIYSNRVCMSNSVILQSLICIFSNFATNKTKKDMKTLRLLSVILFLVATSFSYLQANSGKSHRRVAFRVDKIWGNHLKRSSPLIPKVKSSKFNGDVKLEIGLGKSDKISGGVSTEVSGSNTTKENRKVTIRRKVGSDPLGSIRIYFYDPIIEKKISTSEYQMRTYDTGHIKFGISAY